MNRVFRLALFLFMVCFSISSRATCQASYCGPELLKTLYTDQLQTFIAFQSGQMPPGCTPTSGVYMTLQTSHPNYKAIYATLLSAFVAGLPIEVVATSGSAGCIVSYVVMIH
jgi:hypothetical protein